MKAKIFNRKRVVIGLVVVFLFAAIFSYKNREYLQQLPIGAAFKAKTLCSAVFVSGRDPATVERDDIAFSPLFKLFKAKIDREKKSVTCSLLGIGLFEKKAIYLDQTGCVLLSGFAEETIRARKPLIFPSEPANPENTAWPMGDRLPDGPLPANIDMVKINSAVAQLLSESNPDKKLRTRALLIVHNGRLISESYGPGITKDTPLLSWSIAKSVTNALVGILVMQGKVSLKEPAALPEWQKADDQRREITLDQLLRMSSGLEWVEAYAERPVSDVNKMLFLQPDMAAYAASKPPTAPPDKLWLYSSGTTNLIQRLIRKNLGSQEAYWAFPRRELFNKIGMRSALFEMDAAGTFIGSSYLYATARDYARFGLLYLNDGLWLGERILPPGWVAYSATPTPGAPKGQYGAHFWLNGGKDSQPQDRPYPRLPHDLLFARGYQGQAIAIIPSRRLVVVRLGMTYGDNWGMELFMGNILDAIP